MPKKQHQSKEDEDEVFIGTEGGILSDLENGIFMIFNVFQHSDRIIQCYMPARNPK